jgi:hypothetical protein
VTLSWDDILQPATFAVEATSSLLESVQNFPQMLYDQLGELKKIGAALNVDVPFVDKALDAIVSITDAVKENVVDPVKDLLTNGAATIQDLANEFARALGQAPEEIGPFYDSETKELTLHLHFHKSLPLLNEKFAAELNLADGISASLGATADVVAEFDLDFVFGIDLDDVLAAPTEPGKWAFIRNASADATLAISAADLSASARLGFIGVTVEHGSASAEASLHVALADPGTNQQDGRIDIGELIDALRDDPKALVSADFSGSAELALPLKVEAGFLPDLDVQNLRVVIPNITDLKSARVEGLPDLGDLANFTRLDAAGFVSLLGQVTGWLADFKESDLFSQLQLPVIGPGLNGVLAFSDAFRAKLLFDDGGDGIDGSDKLITDLNAALANAGLANRLVAQASEGRIQFAAIDPTVTKFTVSAVAPLGFAAAGTSDAKVLATGTRRRRPSSSPRTLHSPSASTVARR